MIQTWIRIPEVDTQREFLVPLENVIMMEAILGPDKLSEVDYSKITLLNGESILCRFPIEELAENIHKILTGEE